MNLSSPFRLVSPCICFVFPLVRIFPMLLVAGEDLFALLRSHTIPRRHHPPREFPLIRDMPRIKRVFFHTHRHGRGSSSMSLRRGDATSADELAPFSPSVSLLSTLSIDSHPGLWVTSWFLHGRCSKTVVFVITPNSAIIRFLFVFGQSPAR